MNQLLISLCAFAVFAGPALAAPKPKKNDRWYQGLGAPADPKVPAHWNRYHDHGQATRMLKQITKAHPKIAKLDSLGKSFGKRDMWLMTLSGAGDADKKPAMWIDGGIHANEIQSVEVVLYTAWFLTEMYDRHPEVRRLLDERTFYLMPMMSPDSRDDHFYKANMTHTPRSGQRPIDDDRDGQSGEDPADDLNRDGHITQMRVRDPNGRYKPHDEFPQYMVRAKPGEKGKFTLLGSEGVDNDGDGRVNEDGDGGYYDPNRGWGWNWQPEHV
ncbi:MAG: M14 family metallopeptidase, partial [Pirellulales bacterium]|nr:M14 family metallopeptidase [Pirellulales bacterium]